MPQLDSDQRREYEERKAARDATQEELLRNVKARRVEVLEDLSTADERHKAELARLLNEGRELGLSMAAMTRAAGWKSRQTAYDALGE
jgi:precorrin-6B methylase 1